MDARRSPRFRRRPRARRRAGRRRAPRRRRRSHARGSSTSELVRCDLAGCDFSEAAFHRVRFVDCRLRRRGARPSDVPHRVRSTTAGSTTPTSAWRSSQAVRFESSVLARTDFGGARLDDVSFRGCDLTGADFSNARCSNVDLRGARLVGVKGVGFAERRHHRRRSAPRTRAGYGTHARRGDSDPTKTSKERVNLRSARLQEMQARGHAPLLCAGAVRQSARSSVETAPICHRRGRDRARVRDRAAHQRDRRQLPERGQACGQCLRRRPLGGLGPRPYGPFTSSNLVEDAAAVALRKTPGVTGADPVGILHATMRIQSPK